MEIGGAYPAEAEVESYRRRVALTRSTRKITLCDTWRLARAERLQMNFMSPVKPESDEQGLRFWTESGNVLLSYDTACWRMELETRHLTDAKLTASWGSKMHRITLTCEHLLKEGAAEFVISGQAQGG